MSSTPSPAAPAPARFGAGFVAAVHAYGLWLAKISWLRFFLLAPLLLILTGVLQNVPPFNLTYTRSTVVEAPRVSKDGGSKPPAPPAVPAPPKAPTGVTIHIDDETFRIGGPAAAASGASAPEPPTVEIRLPPGSTPQAVRDAVDEAKRNIREALEEAQREAAEAAREAATEAAADAEADARGLPRVRLVEHRVGESLPMLAFLWIVMSGILKIVYAGRLQAEVKAAVATETAEAESLKRQVVEAKMAAMQAQVEPHFLFNTLASIDHLIETDPKRASAMQKHLIALLRASMPTMREANANGGGVRELGRELAVITPYLEILKMRMEDRLQTVIDVPEGLRSAEFPPMMIQGLVENAIKHGLEPKPEGGSLSVRAEIVHGKLAVTVADTGLGFGRAATAGTGIGLDNIRERLKLLYGGKASLAVTENQPSGTRVTITVPYAARMADEGARA